MNAVLAQVIAGLVAVASTVMVKLVEHYLQQRIRERRSRTRSRARRVESSEGEHQ